MRVMSVLVLSLVMGCGNKIPPCSDPDVLKSLAAAYQPQADAVKEQGVGLALKDAFDKLGNNPMLLMMGVRSKDTAAFDAKYGLAAAFGSDPKAVEAVIEDLKTKTRAGTPPVTFAFGSTLTLNAAKDFNGCQVPMDLMVGGKKVSSHIGSYVVRKADDGKMVVLPQPIAELPSP
jgi:hypothetical protein